MDELERLNQLSVDLWKTYSRLRGELEYLKWLCIVGWLIYGITILLIVTYNTGQILGWW